MKNFVLIFLICTFNLYAKDYQLNCSDSNIYTDLGTATLNLQTSLTIKNENDYVISGGTFELIIGDDWSNQKVILTQTANQKNYRPRTYTGYIKFPDFAGNKFCCGGADLLIKKEDIHSEKQNIQAIFILSAVEDHWGDTLSVDCILK